MADELGDEVDDDGENGRRRITIPDTRARAKTGLRILTSLHPATFFYFSCLFITPCPILFVHTLKLLIAQ
jgi:hypothetical protein